MSDIRKRLALSALVIGGLSVAFPAQADGPFGTRMGAPKSDFKNLQELEPNFYSVDEVGKSNSLFDFYRVSFAPSGLCMVDGVGRDVGTHPSGRELIAEMDKIRDALTAKYGDYEIHDRVSDTLEDSSEDTFLREVSNEERTLSYCWFEDNQRELPNDIESLCLNANAYEYDGDIIGYVNLRYEFDNFEDCRAMEDEEGLDDL